MFVPLNGIFDNSRTTLLAPSAPITYGTSILYIVSLCSISSCTNVSYCFKSFRVCPRLMTTPNSNACSSNISSVIDWGIKVYTENQYLNF